MSTMEILLQKMTQFTKRCLMIQKRTEVSVLLIGIMACTCAIICTGIYVLCLELSWETWLKTLVRMLTPAYFLLGVRDLIQSHSLNWQANNLIRPPGFHTPTFPPWWYRCRLIIKNLIMFIMHTQNHYLTPSLVSESPAGLTNDKWQF